MKIESGMKPVFQQEPTKEQDAAMKKVATQYESLFVNQLVGAMRKTITPGGLIPESHAERVYRSMLDTEYAQKVADTGQLGLAKIIYHQLKKTSGGE